MEFPVTIESQDEFDKLIGPRLSREREKFADYEDLKLRIDSVEAEKVAAEQARDAALSERDEAAGKVQQFEADKQVNEWRAEVAKVHGVPVDALRGSTKEDFEAHAAILKPLITVRGPVIPGQGEIPAPKRVEPGPGVSRLAHAFDTAIETN